MSAAVIFCICKGAPYDIYRLSGDFAQVPLYLRQNVTAVTTIPKDQTSAYAAGQAITLFSKTRVDADLLVHESAHCQDGGFSSSAAWKQAISSDKCVPDYYARRNEVEDYAQVNVAWIYLQASGSLPSPGGGCMQHQLDALSGRNAAGMQQFSSAAKRRDLNSLICSTGK